MNCKGIASIVSEIERSSEGRGGLGGFVNIEEVGPGGWDEEHHTHANREIRTTRTSHASTAVTAILSPCLQAPVVLRNSLQMRPLGAGGRMLLSPCCRGVAEVR